MGSKLTRLIPGRLAGALFFLAMLACALALAPPRAQAQAVQRKPAAPAPPDTSPLARYVPKENLVAYCEFSGLDAHEAAWKNTASYKMLNDTTLGEMLGALSEQLLEKLVSIDPNLRLNGAEIVSLVKHSARSGWVLALNSDPKAPNGYRGTFVLRGGASRENRAVASRLMGWVMGAAKRKSEPKEGRNPIVVRSADPQAQSPESGWVWWAEKNDLVVAFMNTGSADAIMATLDGKKPSAVEHERVKELAKVDGTFEPVCFGFVDPAGASGSASPLQSVLTSLKTEAGAERLELSWGFQGDALLSVVRLVAAKPRKGMLALFDGPTFSKTSLLPMPDQIDSFLETSISSRHLVELIKQMAPSSVVKEQIDDIAESLRTAGSIDLEKDLLAHLGPRIVAYLAPGRSAATNDNSLETALSGDMSPTAALAALQSAFPKLTLAAEVKNPEAFSKGLDAVIVALNNELKAQAIEKALEERKEAEKKDAPATGRGGGRMGAGGGDRNKPRRSIQSTPAPRFLMTATAGKAKVYILDTPSGSPLQLGPKSFRPTIELEGSHVVFAVSPEAARAALAAVRRKDWKPPENLAKVCENVADKLVLLGVNDVSDTLPPLLASLPGTLQTLINTSLALAKHATGGRTADTPASGPAAAIGEAQPRGRKLWAVADGVRRRAASMRVWRGGTRPVGDRGPAGGPRRMPPPLAAQSGTPASTTDSAIIFNIDAEKLPKAADLKSFLFPSTLSIAVTDQDIRIVSREAFPDFASFFSALPAAGMMPGVQKLVDQSTKASAATAAPAAAAPAAPSPPGGRGGPATKGGLPGRGRR